MTTGTEIIERSKLHWGHRYVFGSEVKIGWEWYRDAPAFDCSEFTQGTFGSFGIFLPDGSGAQGDYITRCDIEEAIVSPGFLLGHDPVGGKPGHVVMSRGDGSRKSSEARSTAMGIGSWPLDGRPFTWAGSVPGMDIVTKPATIPTPAAGSFAELVQALNFVKQLKVGPGLDNPQPAVDFIRAGIDHLEKGKIPLTGPYDDQLRQEIDNLQRFFRIDEHGIVGPLTWDLLYPVGTPHAT
jgi:hypothetical protein